MCNASLVQGGLPVSQRLAIVTPRLKKAGADPTDVRNYRFFSNLTFLSKIVEKLICRQLVAFLERHKLILPLQSAYRCDHSTETAVLMHLWQPTGVTLLGMLCLSAAFDAVDHSILINRLRNSFDVSGLALSWIDSFISGRT